MQTQEEYQAQIIKRKRTKRNRPPSPLGFQMVSSSSSTAGETGETGEIMGSDYSSEYEPVTDTSSEEEDQDMANCLILLAQGRGQNSNPIIVREKTAESLYIYQCKTCDRCFPSFQALGGHRASHKKPKNNFEELRNSNTILSLQISPSFVAGSNTKAKVHECSICKAEFSSGQALGGHMRRHRAVTNVGTVVMKKERHVLELDLNLPAPEDDRHRTVAVFPASSLVDCLY